MKSEFYLVSKLGGDKKLDLKILGYSEGLFNSLSSMQ